MNLNQGGKDLLNQIRGQQQNLSAGFNPSDFFQVRTMNEIIEEAKKLEIPNMLFSELWFENEICLFFAGSNTGKSIIAIQIADSISRGKAIEGFKLESPAQRVLYIDYELQPKQLEKRYSEHYNNHYKFSDNFYRLAPNYNHKVPKGISQSAYVLLAIESIIQQTRAKVLIIDNLSFVGGGSLEKGADACLFMQELKIMRERLGLSILVMAHTPKRQSEFFQLTKNDLHGSKMLMNYCDAAFALGASTMHKDIRYIKQIKERSTAKQYGLDNVITVEINGHKNFLKFDQVGYNHELEHLKQMELEDLQELERQIIQLYDTGDFSYREIAQELKTSKTKVGNIIKNHKASLEAEKKRIEEWNKTVDEEHQQILPKIQP